VFERVKPLFELMGKNIVHIGDHGAGQVAKACNQIVVAAPLRPLAPVSDTFSHSAYRRLRTARRACFRRGLDTPCK
jgi:hypothetical protein